MAEAIILLPGDCCAIRCTRLTGGDTTAWREGGAGEGGGGQLAFIDLCQLTKAATLSVAGTVMEWE